jgi:small conductance mechanosensitive channel
MSLLRRSRRPMTLFESRTEQWRQVGLGSEIDRGRAQRARGGVVLIAALIAGVLIVFNRRHSLFPGLGTPVRIVTVIALLGLGWALARNLGRGIVPPLFRRLDPGTAGTVGFLIRLFTVLVMTVIALRIAGLSPNTLAVGGAFTAVIVGLAAQQTLGNLFAGMVLLSARPFRVGERVRLQAGAVGGSVEGIVSSLGLLYTTLARGEDRVLIPNSVVLAAAVVPIREPDPVDVKVRLRSGISMTQIQEILDDQVTTPTRTAASVLLEEIDGDDVVVRVQATPERASEGARLADEIVGALATVTGEHATVGGGSVDHR